MLKLNQRGIVHLLFILFIFILIIGIIGGVYLVQQRTNLKPKAYEVDISTSNVGTDDYDFSRYESIVPTAIQAEMSITVPVNVYEDLNKNNTKDESEKGIPNMQVQGRVLYLASIQDTGEKAEPYVIVEKQITDAFGSLKFKLPGVGIVNEDGRNLKLVPIVLVINIGNFQTAEQSGRDVSEYIAPYGYEISNSSARLKKTYDSMGFPPSLVLNPFGETILNDVVFPIIGTQKISGHVFYDANKNGIKDISEVYQDSTSIIVDASKATNATRRVYYGDSKEDGSFEINNLPPLSQFRVKVSTKCPWVGTTPAFEGFTLGSAGSTDYDFGVIFDENDPCVTN